MRQIIKILIIFSMKNLYSQNLIEFNTQRDIENWVIVNDDVMGGLSKSNFYYSNKHAIFKGEISLENNGGFASVRGNIDKIDVSPVKKINLVIEGDKKNYQLRIKKNKEDYYSYIHNFKTTGKNEIISIELSNFIPYFRGRRLNKENFSHNQIEQISFLIGNKNEENFKLKIKKIFISD
tara:strand:- start:10437 stop:10973 length:537 start_codon:yes stop_codon:yes gene_type:complete